MPNDPAMPAGPAPRRGETIGSVSVPRGRDSLLSAEANRRMFDAVAPRYDLLNRLMSLGLDVRWRQRAVHELQPQSGAMYLDVGCGTADLELDISRHAPGARVVGVDVAMRMLEVGAGKLGENRLEEACQLVAADGARLPFQEASFAGAISAFCLRNLERRGAVLAELVRVLQPGSRLVLLELTRPRSPFLNLGHRLYGRCVVPLLGRAFSRGSAYRYLIASIRHFPSPEVILGELRDGGLRNTSAIPLSGGIATLFLGTRSEQSSVLAGSGLQCDPQ